MMVRPQNIIYFDGNRTELLEKYIIFPENRLISQINSPQISHRGYFFLHPGENNPHHEIVRALCAWDFMRIIRAQLPARITYMHAIGPKAGEKCPAKENKEEGRKEK